MKILQRQIDLRLDKRVTCCGSYDIEVGGVDAQSPDGVECGASAPDKIRSISNPIAQLHV